MPELEAYFSFLVLAFLGWPANSSDLLVSTPDSNEAQSSQNHDKLDTCMIESDFRFLN